MRVWPIWIGGQCKQPGLGSGGVRKRLAAIRLDAHEQRASPGNGQVNPVSPEHRNRLFPGKAFGNLQRQAPKYRPVIAISRTPPTVTGKDRQHRTGDPRSHGKAFLKFLQSAQEDGHIEAGWLGILNPMIIKLAASSFEIDTLGQDAERDCIGQNAGRRQDDEGGKSEGISFVGCSNVAAVGCKRPKRHGGQRLSQPATNQDGVALLPDWAAPSPSRTDGYRCVLYERDAAGSSDDFDDAGVERHTELVDGNDCGGIVDLAGQICGAHPVAIEIDIDEARFETGCTHGVREDGAAKGRNQDGSATARESS